MIHDTRVIPTEGRRYIGAKIRQYFGDLREHVMASTYYEPRVRLPLIALALLLGLS